MDFAAYVGGCGEHLLQPRNVIAGAACTSISSAPYDFEPEVVLQPDANLLTDLLHHHMSTIHRCLLPLNVHTAPDLDHVYLP